MASWQEVLADLQVETSELKADRCLVEVWC